MIVASWASYGLQGANIALIEPGKGFRLGHAFPGASGALRAHLGVWLGRADVLVPQGIGDLVGAEPLVSHGRSERVRIAWWV